MNADEERKHRIRATIEWLSSCTRTDRDSSTKKAAATTYLVGPRYRFKGLGNYRFSPYAKFLIGDGSFNFPYNTGTGNYFVMAPGGGIDYHWKSRFDLRLCDVEYQIWPQFSFGSVSNISASAGLRYRIF